MNKYAILNCQFFHNWSNSIRDTIISKNILLRMNFDWLQPESVRVNVVTMVEAVNLGIKKFWLVDNINPKYMKKFKSEITKSLLKWNYICDELFVWKSCDFPIKCPIIFNIETNNIEDDHASELIWSTFQTISSKIISNSQCSISIDAELSHLTPSLIGILLDYPVVYSITANYNDSRCKLNNSDVQLFRLFYKNICISSFSVPLSISDIRIETECEITREIVNVPNFTI